MGSLLMGTFILTRRKLIFPEHFSMPFQNCKCRVFRLFESLYQSKKSIQYQEASFTLELHQHPRRNSILALNNPPVRTLVYDSLLPSPAPAHDSGPSVVGYTSTIGLFHWSHVC
jgi:hypothetical protein